MWAPFNCSNLLDIWLPKKSDNLLLTDIPSNVIYKKKGILGQVSDKAQNILKDVFFFNMVGIARFSSKCKNT